MKASKTLTVSVSVFRGQISWRFSLSKIIFHHLLQIWISYCFHCDTDQLWTHTQSNNKTKCLKQILFDSQKSDPPICAPFGTKSCARFTCLWCVCVLDTALTPTTKALMLCPLALVKPARAWPFHELSAVILQRKGNTFFLQFDPFVCCHFPTKRRYFFPPIWHFCLLSFSNEKEILFSSNLTKGDTFFPPIWPLTL